jgi:hypothetical protein
MRISPTKVVQLVESEPPQVVLLDESSGEEIVLTVQEFWNLDRVIEHFKPHMVVV